jgi:uncharacterized membrane protein HdeD (DUF308 family)
MSHGSSPAAWTAVVISLIGITVASISLVPEPHWTVFIVGCVLAVAGAPIGKILSAAGFGVDGKGH